MRSCLSRAGDGGTGTQLLDGTYVPQPVRRHAIRKEGGGQRLLGIPTVLDRLIQQAVLQVLTPIFDPEFSESSHGFRPRRSAHGAVKQVRYHIKQGAKVAVDMDLEKFFDTVHHDVLMARVARKATRPLLKAPDPRAVMQKLMDERYPVYASADITVPSRDTSKEDMAQTVIEALRDHLAGTTEKVSQDQT